MVTTHAGAIRPGAWMMTNNGNEYLFIMGDCRYFVMVNAWEEVRSGTLTREQAEAFEERVRYTELSNLAGFYPPAEGVIAGVDSHWFGSPDHGVSCPGFCQAPAEVWEVGDEVRAAQRDLYEMGEAVDGPMRVTLLEVPGGPLANHPSPIAWPLSTQLDEVAITEEEIVYEHDDQYVGVLLEDEADVSALRELRRRLHSGEIDPDWRRYGAYVAITGTDVRYEMRFRDVIELEGEDGFIRF